jgi:deoxyribonuclease V
MLAAIDVQYDEQRATAACVVFAQWGDEQPAAVQTAVVEPVAAYEPGQFYKRELPCALAVLNRLPAPPALIVVDGYVWLGPDRPGLGKHLFDALVARGPRAAVVGVAKNRFAGAPGLDVFRGQSARPLFVTAEGIDVEASAGHVRAMHGAHRFPTLLSWVDKVARGLPPG